MGSSFRVRRSIRLARGVYAQWTFSGPDAGLALAGGVAGGLLAFAIQLALLVTLSLVYLVAWLFLGILWLSLIAVLALAQLAWFAIAFSWNASLKLLAILMH